MTKDHTTIAKNDIDLSLIYQFKDFPDKHSGRCDYCGEAHFKSAVKNGQFIRECRKCGLKKSI